MLNPQFQNLPTPVAAALTELFKMRLDDDVRQQTSLEILGGKPLGVALRHSRAQCARDRRSPGFLSLDERKESEKLGDFSLYELILATDPAEILDVVRESKSRSVEFDEQTEVVLARLAGGAAALGRSLNCTERRGQQLVRRTVDRVAAETNFKKGGRGQGVLFCFDGVVR